jgi:hypothetical protein
VEGGESFSGAGQRLEADLVGRGWWMAFVDFGGDFGVGGRGRGRLGVEEDRHG